MLKSEYLQRVYSQVVTRDPDQKEFHQAVLEVLESLDMIVEKHPEYEQRGVIEALVEPERVITFRVPWADDKGQVHVNRGYRVQFNSAIGPYKGGLRFHPTVNLSILKFLGFEQILKNSLTGLPIGGAKGGSDFDPKGKSDTEVMRFCQSFMTELYRHIGQFTDVPAGDIGVGGRKNRLYVRPVPPPAQHQRGRRPHRQGPDLRRLPGPHRGHRLRPLLPDGGDAQVHEGRELPGQDRGHLRLGNVAIYATEKATQLGGKVVALSDSNGFVHDPDGIKLDIVKDIKLGHRGRIKEYAQRVPGSTYTEGFRGIWTIPCDIALPCATQNEIDAGSRQEHRQGRCHGRG